MRKNTGFTLIETLIVVAILSVVLTVGVPAFTNLIERKSIPKVAQKLEKVLQLARMEATRRGRMVFLQSNGGNWSNGIQVFWDSIGDGFGFVDMRTETVTSNPSEIDIAYTGASGTVFFLPTGQSAGGLFGTFTITGVNSQTNCTATVEVLRSGLIRRTQNQC